jgi:hypothetical protein
MSIKFLHNEIESLFEIDNNNIPDKVFKCIISVVDRMKDDEDDPSELVDEDEEDDYYDDEEESDEEDEYEEDSDNSFLEDYDEEELPESVKKADIEAKKILKECLVSDYI